jgi:uncharacterized protein YybS (DUF2232 family)
MSEIIVVYVSFVYEIIILIVGFSFIFYFCAFKLLDRQQVKKVSYVTPIIIKVKTFSQFVIWITFNVGIGMS